MFNKEYFTQNSYLNIFWELHNRTWFIRDVLSDIINDSKNNNYTPKVILMWTDVQENYGFMFENFKDIKAFENSEKFWSSKRWYVDTYTDLAIRINELNTDPIFVLIDDAYVAFRKIANSGLFISEEEWLKSIDKMLREWRNSNVFFVVWYRFENDMYWTSWHREHV